MATVMEFESPADEFPLGTVFANYPKVTVELERLIPNERLMIPYFWVRGEEVADIEAAFERHAGVNEIELIDSVDDQHLMRTQWKSEYFGILDALAASDVVVLSGVGTKDGWHFEVRGETRKAIGEFQNMCRNNDIEIEITAVHALLPVRGSDYELTEPQREALALAYERGYFDSPRTTSLSELAEELDITQQSLSSRIKRGLRRLVDNALIRE